jgi:TatD DNase family protein
MIDTHAHLNDPRLLPNLDAILRRARAAGVSGIVVVGCDLPTSELAVRLAQEHAGLWATVGVHPHYAAGVDDNAMRQLRELARNDRVVGIGETGLDFYRGLAPRLVQREAFLRHLELAEEMGLPVICHCREAEEMMLEMLAEWRRLPRIWHSFDGTPEQAQMMGEQGVMMGVSGIVTYPNTPWRRAAVAAIPLDHLLLETDAPYLTPYPPEGKRPRDNEPGYLLLIAASAAEARGETIETIVTATNANARRVFSLASPAPSE